MNMAPYAKDAEYYRSAVNRQANVSGMPSNSSTCSRVFHRLMNSLRNLMVLGPVMWCTQALPRSASATDTWRLRFGTAANTVGARSRMLVPCIQLSNQNRVDSPFPSWEIVASLKIASTFRSSRSSSVHQVRLGSTCRSQGHRTLARMR